MSVSLQTFKHCLVIKQTRIIATNRLVHVANIFYAHLVCVVKSVANNNKTPERVETKQLWTNDTTRPGLSVCEEGQFVRKARILPPRGPVVKTKVVC